MDFAAWSWILLASSITAACTASACRWWFGQSMVIMQRRLDQSELARQAAHERAQAARQQVAQLNKTIADLHKRQKAHHELLQRRTQLAATLSAREVEAEAATALPANGFADTMPM